MVEKKETFVPEGHVLNEKGELEVHPQWRKNPETGLVEKDPSKWQIIGKVPINWREPKWITATSPYDVYKYG